MSEQSVVGTPRPVTRAVRAAALVIIAIGAGGVVAHLAPRYGALYVYAAALVSIVWMEGVVFGAIGALAAAATYVVLFARGTFSSSELAVALITSLLLPLLAARRRRAEPPPSLITTAPPDPGELDALRVQLSDTLAKLYEANQQRERLCEQYEQEIELLQHENEEARRRLAPRKPLILVVHHDPALRSQSRDSLAQHGFDTITAADGLEGLRLAVAHKPAVVVADASMPKMDGRELCQLIKSNPETAGVRVLLLTANEREEVMHELAPDELLRKPVQIDALQAALLRLTGSEP